MSSKKVSHLRIVSEDELDLEPEPFLERTLVKMIPKNKHLSKQSLKEKSFNTTSNYNNMTSSIKNGHNFTKFTASYSNPSPRLHRTKSAENIQLKYGRVLTSMHTVQNSLPAIIQQIVSVLESIIQLNHLTIIYRDFDNKRYLVQCNNNNQFPLDPSAPKVLGVGIVNQCLLSKKIIHIQNYEEKHILYSQFEASLNINGNNVLCAPLIMNDESIGCILCSISSEDEQYVKGIDYNELMTLVASNASIALNRYYETQIASIFLKLAYDRSSSDISFTIIIDRLIDYIERLTDGQMASIYFCDHVRKEIWYVSTNIFHGSYDKGIVGRVAYASQPLRVNDCSDKQDDDGYSVHIESLLCVPVLSNCHNYNNNCNNSDNQLQTIAVLQVINKRYHAKFTQYDEDILVRFASEVSKTFSKRILDLRELSLTTYEKQLYLEEGFQREFGIGYTKSRFKMRHTSVSAGESPNTSNNNSTGVSPRHRGLSIRQSQMIPFSPLTPSSVLTSIMTLESHISNWSFNPFLFQDRPTDLFDYIVAMFNAFNLLEEFQIDLQTFQNFLMKILTSYRANHFHNFIHAFSVLHLTYKITTNDTQEILLPIDILSLFISALCHDIDHPGNTNMFECKNKSEWALTHSFESVLEKHHASETHKILINPDTDIIIHLDEVDRQWVTSLITKTILATDMAIHRSLLDKINLRIATFDEPLKYSDDAQYRELRIQLVGFILHCADLGAQTQSLELALEWSRRVNDEFHQQIQKEKELGLSLTEYMVGLDKEEKRCKSQVGFISSFVLPLWKALARLFPTLSDAVDRVSGNERFYQRKYDELTSLNIKT